MCFAVPMKIESIDGFVARCEARGTVRDVSLFMLQFEEIQPGDYVAVHLGQAIEKLSEARAREVWATYDEMLASLPDETDADTDDSLVLHARAADGR